MWRHHSLVVALIGCGCMVARTAAAQNQTPTAPPAPAPPPVVATTPAPPPAAVVHTEHVDTVVVAEPGSNVSVHSRRDSPYARDPARKGALVASSIAWPIGTAVLGVGYLVQHDSSKCTYNYATSVGSCQKNDATDWLVAYDLNMAITPSIPRWVVGDTTGALIYTSLRGASVVAASVVDWKDDAFGPVVLGFLLPLSLGVIDLAMTPHREDLKPAPTDAPSEARAPRIAPTITAFGPAPLTGADHRVNGGMLRMSAMF